MAKKQFKLKKVLLILSIFIFSLFISIIGMVTFFYNRYALDTYKLTSFNNGIKVYSASGNDNTLYNTNRSIIEIESLPKHVKDAFIDIEDKRFYTHNGYDFKRIVKSAFVNLSNQSKSQGASTISQQLVKNALLSNEKTYSRKIKELVLSIKMEKKFSKDDILEMYLNTIYFGSNAYGIENASKIYFNKSAKDLTLNEVCCLAGLIKSPNHYSPKTNYQNSVERKNLVAKTMYQCGNISKNEYNNVINSEIILTYNNQFDNTYEEEAIYEACNLLNITERELINRNYQIITFKDDALQKDVIKSNKDIINNTENKTKTSLDSLSVVANNKGNVLAYYTNSNYCLHNLKRQPASLLKPLAVYLPCIQHNILSPSTQILDEKINYNGFSPENADKKYHGYVSTRYSLANSLNIPAVKALDYLGLKKSRECLTKLGINISNSDMNLSLALGAVKHGVKLTDLLSAYITLSNGGNYSNLNFVNKILDKNNKVIYSYEDYTENVASKEDCFLVTDMLKDSAKSGTAKRLASLNLPIASKTGTASINNGNTDLYNIAYTTEHTILTWVADIDNITLDNSLLSSSQPTDINKEICLSLYKNHKPKDFETPENVALYPYDITELEDKHILITPNHNIERYISYDYFKTENAPKKSEINDEFKLNLHLDRTGLQISFDAKKYYIYNIYRKDKKGKKLIKQIKEQNGEITFKDNDVFNFEEIEYFVTNENDVLISEIKTIRPKDYLITLLDNEILQSKKNWLV